jgi:hypothetical protein
VRKFFTVQPQVVYLASRSRIRTRSSINKFEKLFELIFYYYLVSEFLDFQTRNSVLLLSLLHLVFNINMSIVSSSFKAPSWRRFFIDNNALKYSDDMLSQIREAGSHGTSPVEIFETFSKNPGIGLLCLDADDETLLMLHNPTVIGGTWYQSEKKLVALSGFDSKATALRIKEKSIIDIKQKVPLWKDILDALANSKPLQDIKGKKELFHYKNIVPVPHSLLKAFLDLKQFDPNSVAQALYAMSLVQASEIQDHPSTQGKPSESSPSSSSDDSESTVDDDSADVTDENENAPTSKTAEHHMTPVTRNQKERATKTPSNLSTSLLDSVILSPWFSELQHIFYFCYLCSINKMDHVTYSIQYSPDIADWQASIEGVHLSGVSTSHPLAPNATLTNRRSESIDEDDITVDSSISLKDRHMIHTLLKISENLDQNTLRIAKESEEKSKGFAKLE